MSANPTHTKQKRTVGNVQQSSHSRLPDATPTYGEASRAYKDCIWARSGHSPFDFMLSMDEVCIVIHHICRMAKYDFSASNRFLYRVAICAGDPISDNMFYLAIHAMGADQIGLHLKSDLLLEVDERQDRKRGRPTANILKRRQLAADVAFASLSPRRSSQFLISRSRSSRGSISRSARRSGENRIGIYNIHST
jgi:hypothetical protein